MLEYLRGPYWAPPIIGVAVALGSYLILVRAMRRALDAIRGVLSTVGATEREQEAPEELEVDYDEVNDEDLMMVYYFVSYIARKIYREHVMVRVEAFGNDLVGIYPEPESEQEQEQMDYESFEEPNSPQAEFTNNNTLVIRLPWSTFRLLASAIRRGEGEAVVASSEDEMRAIYEVAKVVAAASDDDALAPYSAYKVLTNMASEGVLRASRDLMDLLPFESKELRRKIREQVTEESRS